MDDKFKQASLDYQAGKMTLDVIFYLEMLKAHQAELLEIPEQAKPKPTMKDITSLGLLNSPVHQAWRTAKEKEQKT